MASFKHRQPSDTNQSVPETESVPETHSYQEKHFQPTLNEPVVETEQYTEYGATVKPDPTRARSNPTVKSDVTERSDQPGEEDVLAKDRLNRSLQGNSDSGTQYSTPDVGSGVSSGSEGYAHTYGSVGSTSAAGSPRPRTPPPYSARQPRPPLRPRQRPPPHQPRWPPERHPPSWRVRERYSSP